MKIDKQDRRLLEVLQHQCRISAQELADKTNMSSATCWRRLKALEESGVIKNYLTELDNEKLGLNISAIVFVQMQRNSSDNAREFEQQIRNCPPIIECLALTGKYDYLLRVVAPNLKEYDQFIKNKLANIDHIDRIDTTIILDHVLSNRPLPIPLID